MKRLFIQFVLPLLSLVALSSCESYDDSPSIPPAILEKVNEVPIPDGYGFDNFMENSTFLGVLWTCDENGE